MREIRFEDLPDGQVVEPGVSGEISFDSLPDTHEEIPFQALPEARDPTSEEQARPDLFSYQPPARNLLGPAPRPRIGDAPELKTVPPAPAPILQPPAPGAAREVMAREREAGLQGLSERLPLSPEEFNTAAAKGAAGATPGIPQPRLSTREEATGGQYLGAAIPPVAALATGGAAPAVMAAYSGLEAMKPGGVDETTGAPAHPFSMATQTAIGAILGGPLGQTLLGRAAGMGGIQAVQAGVEEYLRQKSQGDPSMAKAMESPEFLKQLAVAAVQGMLGAYGTPHGQGPAREAPAAPERGTAITGEMVDAFSRQPPPAPEAPRPAPQEVPGRPGEALPPWGAAPVPEDLRGRQWAQGNQAAEALRAAEQARQEPFRRHEAAVRAAVEAENALLSRFPDPEGPLRLPAERDMLRDLRTRKDAADQEMQAARAALDEANRALEEARRMQERAVPVELPDMPPDMLQGRRQVIEAMRRAGRTDAEIELATRIADRNPEGSYGRTRTQDIAPEDARILLAEDGPLARAAQLQEDSPQLAFETVDFGEGSPYQAKFPQFKDMPYEQKAKASQELVTFTHKIASHLAGVSGKTGDGPGVWEDYPFRPNAKLQADTAPEKARVYAALQGYLHQQDAVFLMRRHASGKKLGVDIQFEGGRPGPEKLSQLWAFLRKEAPELAQSAMPTENGIYMAREDMADPAVAKNFQEKYHAILERAEQALGLNIAADVHPVDWELVQSGGWNREGGGNGYLEILARELGPDTPERLGRIYAPAVESQLRKITGGSAERGPVLQEHDAAHGRGVGDRSGEPAHVAGGESGLARRFGIDPEGLKANTPEVAKSVYKTMGNRVADRNTQADLKIYPLHDIADPEAKLAEWSAKTGWKYRFFGPDRNDPSKFLPPDFRESYPQKTAWVFSPWEKHGSFGDTPYTLMWRVTHEVAHGMVNDAVTARFGGPGKRAGALGFETIGRNGNPHPPLSLADALRAVEWEVETFIRQREILEKDFGITITEEQFRKENAINLADATYRVLTGDFSDPGESGLVPSAMNPDQALARAKDILRQRAKDLGLDMAETFGEAKGPLFQEDQPLFQAGRDIKGAFVPGDKAEKGLVYLVQGRADLSTFLHEHGHAVLESILREDPGFKADLSTVERWIRSVDGEEAIGRDGTWTKTAKETFARGVERYFYDGKTDVPELKPIFERIRAWMQKVYQQLLGSPIAREIPEEVRQVMDRLLGGKRGADWTPEPAPKPKAPPKRGPTSEPPYIPEGVKPSKGVPGERSLPKTLEENGLPGGESREYRVKTNAETMAKVSVELSDKGLEKAASEIRAKDKPSAEQTAKAITIMRRWQADADKLPAGEEKEALMGKVVELATTMSKRLTNLGQAIQAVRIIENLSEDGVVFYAERKLANLNEHRPPNRQIPSLTPDQAGQLRSAARVLATESAFGEEAKAVAKVAEKMGGKEVLSDEDRATLRTFREKMTEYMGKPARKPKKEGVESVEAFLEARERAALARLKAKGIAPAKTLFQATTKLGEAEIEDLADIFASRMAKRGDKSAAAIRQNFREAFGEEVGPHLDQIAQRGMQKLTRARGDRSRLAAVVRRADDILAPLVESGNPALAGEAERLRGALFELRKLSGGAKIEAGQDLQAALQALAPPTLLQQVSTVQTIAQLLNPKTLARNVIGNEAFYYLERLSKIVATPIDLARSKLTGKDREVTFRTGGQGEYWKAFLTGARAAARGVNPEGIETAYDLKPPAFKGKYNPFTYLEKALGVALRGTDYAAYQRAKGQTLGELASLAADRMDVPAGSRKKFIRNWVENADERIQEIADAYGKYVTFQDETHLAKMAANIKKGLNKATYLGTIENPGFGLGDLILKYPKTPANLFMRALDYSPAGFLRSAYLLSEPWRTGNGRNVREVEMALSRAVVGSLGLTGLGYYLAAQGALTGRSEKDKDTREFLRDQTGERNFQVNVSALARWVTKGFRDADLKKQEGDRLVSYDWMQPMAINLAMAATANQNIHDKKHPISGALATLGAGAVAGVEALQEQPFLQGISQLASSDKNKNIAEKLADVLEGAPASFVPAVVNQVRQAMDNTKRETRDETMLQRTLNKVVARLPWFSETLPAAYKTLGKDAPKENYQGGTNGLWNVFVNPAFVSKYHIDPELAAIIGPYEAEGRTQQFPYVVPKKIQYTYGREKKALELSGEDYSALQRLIATNTARAFQGLDTEALKAKTAEHQEKELAARVKGAWERSRREFLKSKGVRFNP